VKVGMRKIFRFSFQRESYWLVAIYVVVPLVAILLFIVIPGLWRRWSP
jgi:competence protein ComGC